MLRYKGGGFLRGVPARDLKDDEVAKWGANYLVRSGLYEFVKPEPAQAPDSDREAPATIDEAPKRKFRRKKE